MLTSANSTKKESKSWQARAVIAARQHGLLALLLLPQPPSHLLMARARLRRVLKELLPFLVLLHQFLPVVRLRVPVYPTTPTLVKPEWEMTRREMHLSVELFDPSPLDASIHPFVVTLALVGVSHCCTHSSLHLSHQQYSSVFRSGVRNL